MKASKFHTVVDIPNYNWKTDYSKKNMFLGSCFAENIGNKMTALKYQTDINPFGILYNPMSVANGLKMLLHEKEFTNADLIPSAGLWHSFSHHGKFSCDDKSQTLQGINSRTKLSSAFLKESDFLIVTFGTAWIYKFKSTGQIVSNCHKIPASDFERVRLSVPEIVDEYLQLIADIQQVNPKIKVVFTVSPIRHWKDGAAENQRSKATLLLAIDELTKKFGNNVCTYFPAYEIIMDELRDYRFYTEDMIHLSDVAINHIWKIFENSFINAESKQIALQIGKFVQALNHRPLHQNSSEYLKFVQQMLKRVTNFAEENTDINLSLEKEYFITELNIIEQKMGKIKL